jgi:hypothetical protein
MYGIVVTVCFSSGYLVTVALLQELPQKGKRASAQIYNAILRLEYFPRYWKIGQIIMIVKSGKNPTEVTSYRPISLLTLLSKILEKILPRRMTPILTAKQLLPDNQFGFRPQHGTIEQEHKLVRKIHEALTANVSALQALLTLTKPSIRLYKLKQALPHPMHSLLKSYLTDRMYQVRYQEEYTGLFINPSGISDHCGRVAGMVTPKGSISTEGETLQVSVLPYRCSICAPLVTRQMSIL